MIHFSGSDEPKMLFVLPINVEVPTIVVGISKFVSRKNFMLSRVEHKNVLWPRGQLYPFLNIALSSFPLVLSVKHIFQMKIIRKIWSAMLYRFFSLFIALMKIYEPADAAFFFFLCFFFICDKKGVQRRSSEDCVLFV